MKLKILYFDDDPDGYGSDLPDNDEGIAAMVLSLPWEAALRSIEGTGGRPPWLWVSDAWYLLPPSWRDVHVAGLVSIWEGRLATKEFEMNDELIDQHLPRLPSE